MTNLKSLSTLTAAAATEALQSFRLQVRLADGVPFYSLVNNPAEWVFDMVRDALGNERPSVEAYDAIVGELKRIAEGGEVEASEATPVGRAIRVRARVQAAYEGIITSPVSATGRARLEVLAGIMLAARESYLTAQARAELAAARAVA